MISHISPSFRKALEQLPKDARRQARAAYRLWKDNPLHPGLDFKRVGTRWPLYSVRVGLHWRAVGRRLDGDEIVWFWIGSHAEYDHFVARL